MGLGFTWESDDLRVRPAHVQVVVTGRNAAPDLFEAADLVTEMTLVKHPFESGQKAQMGVDFWAATSGPIDL